MSALREIALSLGLDFDQKAAAQVEQSIANVVTAFYRLNRAAPGSAAAEQAAEDVDRLKGATTRFLGTLAVAGYAVHAFATSIAAQAHEVRVAATALRVTTDQLQSTRNAFELGGLSAHDAAGAFATFHRTVRAAATAGGEGAGAFYRLGIRLRENDRTVRSSSAVLDDVAARFERIQNPARRARLATQLFGEAGLQLLPVLHRGAGGLAELRAEFEQLGGGTTPAAIEAARQYEAAMTRWRIVGDAARSQLAIGLLPALTFLVDKVRAVSRWFVQLFQHTHGVRNALGVLAAVGIGLAAALIIAWAPVIAPFLAAAVAATALYLIIDDFVTFLEGGRSVIGAFIDELFGPGTAEMVRQHLLMVGQLREAWEGVALAIHDALAAIGLAESQSPTDRRNASDAATRASAAAVRARLAAQRAAINPALNAHATVTGTIPIAASLPGRARAGATQVTTHRTVAPTIHVHGVTNPDAVAARVQQIITRTERDARDADHPLQPRDES